MTDAYVVLLGFFMPICQTKTKGDTIMKKRTAFEQAITEVRELARQNGEEYFSVRYKYTEDNGKPHAVECEVYIHHATIFDGATFSEAIGKLKAHYNPPVPDLSEAPREIATVTKEV
jgi:hypothetical protein